MAVAFAGVVLVAFIWLWTGHSNVLGAGLCVVAALTYSISLVIKTLVRRLSALKSPGWPALECQRLCKPGSRPRAQRYHHRGWSTRRVPDCDCLYGGTPALIRASQRLGVGTCLVPPITALIGLVALHGAPAIT